MNKLFAQELLSPMSHELDQLLVCLERQSLSRAAEEGGWHQGNLSRVVQGFEFRLGEKLFHRSPRGLVLTAVGMALRDSLRLTKKYWQHTLAEKLAAEQEVGGVFRIGCHESIAANTYPKFLPEMMRQFPAVKFSTELLTSLEVTRRIVEFQVDFGLVINPIKNSDLVVKPIQEEFLALWGADSRSKALEVLVNPNMFMARKLLRRFADKAVVEIPSYEVIAVMVKERQWLGLLPNTVAERSGLVQLSAPMIRLKLSAAWHVDFSRQARRFIIIENILATLKSSMKEPRK